MKALEQESVHLKVKIAGGKRAASIYSNIEKHAKRKCHQDRIANLNRISGLKIYLPSEVEEYDINVIGSLVESCQKSKKTFEFIDDFTEDVDKKITFFLEGRKIASATASNKKDAKRKCAENSIKYLRQHHEVIFKDQINHDSVAQIEKHNLVKDSYAHAPKLADDNLGCKLLKKMGWDGSSGVGKFNQGRCEPVFIDTIESRKGLGHECEDQSIRKTSVEKTLRDFLKDSEQNDIKFSKDLSKEDRALVHKLCQRYHLRHRSFGKGEERYLVVSKQ